MERRRLPWASGSLDGPDSLLPTLRAARLAQKKQTLILDKSKSDTEARQLEEKKRLAAALEEAEEEARLAEEAALLVSEDEADAATLISAMIRGMWARAEADKLRATYERDVEARENKKIFRAASLRTRGGGSDCRLPAALPCLESPHPGSQGQQRRRRPLV